MNPTKKTPEMRARLIELRRTGLSLEKCYKRAGISKKTVHDWRKEDPTLDEELEKAQADFISEYHDVVNQGAKEDPNLALKWLSRLAPEDYSETQRTEVSFTLEMPGLLDAKTDRARAWLTGASDKDWKELDKRAAAGELTDADYELLEEPEEAPDEGDA